jgi:hypothetical protein
MACNNLASILKGCDTNSGGIYEAYIIDQDDIVSYTANASTHTITAMTISTGVTYSTYQFKRNVGNMVIAPAIDLVNGSSFFNHTISLVFHKREASKSRALQILGEGQRYLSIILKDANGLYWYVSYAQLNGGDEDTGTAKADGSKVTVTFLAEMDNRAYAVDSSLIAGLIA